MGIQFQNKYLPKYYPIAGCFFVAFYIAGLVLFTMWSCKNTQFTRFMLKLSGFFILFAVLALIVLCLCLITTWDKEHENLRVGNGDDDGDYVDYSRSTFFLNYLIGGAVILAVDTSLI